MNPFDILNMVVVVCLKLDLGQLKNLLLWILKYIIWVQCELAWWIWKNCHTQSMY